jgi:signal transduction histidine kinase
MSDLMRHNVEEAHVDAIDRLRQIASERTKGDVSPLVRSRLEEGLGTWLEEHAVPKAWDLAGTFADAGVTVEDLEGFTGVVPKALQADALGWVACGLSVERIVGEIASSAGRISELVASVKVYSHMDRSPEHRPTDVREGLDNTLTLLSHKLKQKQISVVRDYQDHVPMVPANAGELNQVWTNLLDNAIDAVNDDGEVRLKVRGDETHLTVNIVDNGHGIPEDVRARIFDPFFTTKRVGEGTGLGLDIAMRIVKTHRGSLTVQSKPGKTMARVRLPVAPRSS